MAHCLWDNYEGHHKYHLANWGLVTRKKKSMEGLGIPDLLEMNMCLLASWIKRYHLNENKLWKQIVDNKYNVDNPNFFSCSSSGASPFWKGVMWAAKAAKMGYQWKVGDGKNIKFWEDHWFGSCSLAIQYWVIYFLVNEQNKTIVDLWDGSSLKVTFRRCFDHRLMMQKFRKLLKLLL
jgi:hypothetical protein